jgi:hypothetical protein
MDFIIIVFLIIPSFTYLLDKPQLMPILFKYEINHTHRAIIKIIEPIYSIIAADIYYAYILSLVK